MRSLLVRVRTALLDKLKARVLLWPFLLLILILIGALISNADFNRKQNETTTREIKELNRKLDTIRDEQIKRNNQQDQKNKELEGKIVQRKIQREANAVLATLRPTVPQVLPIGCGNYRPLIAQYSWNVETALKVCNAESGGNPYAANWTDHHSTCTGSFGLFQIACFDGQVYDPATNVAIAFRKYQASGWTPWGVCLRRIVSCI